MLISPSDAWVATQGQLEMQLHQATYDTWVRDARFVSYSDQTFTISVTNAYAKDWLEQRLFRVIERTLKSIFAQGEIQIQFIVQTAQPAKKTGGFGPLLDAEFAPPRSFKDIEKEPETIPVADLVAPPVEKLPPVQFGEGQRLNSDYTLQNYVSGIGMAYAAAQAIVQSPGSAFSPLYIYGGVGSGKTHLLQAIGNALQDKHLRVLYLSAETFTNDLIRAIRIHQTEAFREFYRNADVLIVDDIQFIAGKDSTQQEFFHTFNDLHNQNRQIILAGDRKPKDMVELDERLRSRFEWGLTVELTPADFDTRLRILEMKALEQDIHLPREVAAQIAQQVQGSIRDLEGVLNQVLAQVALTRQPLNTDTLSKILQKGSQKKAKDALELNDIFEATARFHQLSLDDLLGKQRSQEIAMARHIAIYLAREEINATLPSIGRALGGRTHSTILNSYRKVADLIETDPIFRQSLKELRQHIQAMK